jgi:hypothetical protein
VLRFPFVDVRRRGGDTGIGPSSAEVRAAARLDAETAERVRRLRVNLVRLDVALAAWDAWDEDQRRPLVERRGVPMPMNQRELLVLVRTVAVAYLRQFEAGGS